MMTQTFNAFLVRFRFAAMAVTLGASCAVSPVTASANQWSDTGKLVVTYNGWWRTADVGAGGSTTFNDNPSTPLEAVVIRASKVASIDSLADCYGKSFPPHPDPATVSDQYCLGPQVQSISVAGVPMPTFVLYKNMAGDAKLTFYEDENFVGHAPQSVTPSDTFSLGDLSQIRYPNNLYPTGTWNDRIRSIKIPYGMTLTVHSDINFGGDRLDLRGDALHLGTQFDRAISSMKINNPR